MDVRLFYCFRNCSVYWHSVLMKRRHLKKVPYLARLPVMLVQISFYFFMALPFSCGGHKDDLAANMRCDGQVQCDCDATTFDEVLNDKVKYESKCITLEGYLSLNFEYVAIYRSDRDRRNMKSKNAYWLNFNDSLINCLESKTTIFNKQKVTVKGRFTSSRKGHLNSYSGEIDNVVFVQRNK